MTFSAGSMKFPPVRVPWIKSLGKPANRLPEQKEGNRQLGEETGDGADCVRLVLEAVTFRKGRSPSGCSWWWRQWRHRTQTARSWCRWHRWSGCRSPWCPFSCSGPQTDTGCKLLPPRRCWSLKRGGRRRHRRRRKTEEKENWVIVKLAKNNGQINY